MSRLDQGGGLVCPITSAMRVWSTLGHVAFTAVGGTAHQVTPMIATAFCICNAGALAEVRRGIIATRLPA